MATLHCTILARNYLPRALVLAESLRRHGDGSPLVIYLTDVTVDDDLPQYDGVRWMTAADIDLPARRVLELAAGYDLVEFATAVKPLVLTALLHEADHVVYVDPDTYLVSPLVELGPALDAGSGIVLTPHFLKPTDDAGFSEAHLLHVGVFNLGFCAVSRDARAFLEWWWGHLETECLHGPLDGLFTDQKWADVGSVLFGATALRHAGYNVSVANLQERPVARDDDGYLIATSGDRLRLLHFHAFDPHRPEALYGRQSTAAEGVSGATAELGALAREYAAQLLDKQRLLGGAPPYRYASDTTGRPISRRMRHAYRHAVQATPGGVPSPFIAAEAEAYERWRRGAGGLAARLIVSDLAKGMRCALPEEYDQFKRRFPRLARRLRGRWVEDSGMWG